MESERDLKMAIAWNRVNLKIFGAWPDPHLPDGRFAKYRSFIAGAFTTCSLIVPQSSNLFLIWGNLELVSENLATANIPAITAVLKLIFIQYHQEALRPLVKSFYDDWRNAKTEEERATMMGMAKTARNISVWCTMLTQIMLTCYFSLRTIAISTGDRNQVNQDHLIMFPGYVPYDVRPTPILILTNIGQIIGACFGATVYTSVDSFIAMIILHTCGQFRNLRRKLERLMGNDGVTKNSEEIQKELASIVKRHEHLEWSLRQFFVPCYRRMAREIEDCFNVLLLLQILMCTIELCFQGFMFLKVLVRNGGLPLVETVFFLSLFGFVIVHTYIYCYIGEVLIVESSGMSNSAYESNWYNATVTNARCLLFIMHKSIRPLRLTAGKFGTLSMQMFSSFIRTSMGYLSVLLTVSNGTN